MLNMGLIPWWQRVAASVELSSTPSDLYLVVELLAVELLAEFN